MAKVSVIIPVYNTANYLEKCLESVINQTLKDIEIICINDGSDDNSLNILTKYSEKDKRIKLINFSKNKGASKARNEGIKLAKGEYIGFVDSDDYIDLDFYEKLYNSALLNNADMVKSNLKQIGWDKPEAQNYGNLAQVKKNKLRFIHIPTAIFKNHFLNSNNILFPENLQCKEDSIFELKAAINANKIEIEDSVNYYYCYRDNSLNHETTVTMDKLKDIEKSLKMYFEILDLSNVNKDDYFDVVEANYRYLTYYCSDKKVSPECLNYAKGAEDKLLSYMKYGGEFKKQLMFKRVQQKWRKQLKIVNTVEKFNKKEIDSIIESSSLEGIEKNKKDKKLILSLTSFPDRMYDIHYCLYSLLNQTLKPDEIVLYLGVDKFLNKEKDLPDKIIKLKNWGLTVKFVKDIRSYTKLIPALIDYPNSTIVTADDDIYYPPNWLEKLYNEHLKHPKNIICHRAHRVSLNSNGKISPYKMWKKEIENQEASFFNFLTGVGGVLYPSNSLYQDILNKDAFLKLAPLADDVWFWAMSVLNNTTTRIVPEPIKILTYINPDREYGISGEYTLASQNVSLGKNDEQINNILNYYPKIMEKLKEERGVLVGV